MRAEASASPSGISLSRFSPRARRSRHSSRGHHMRPRPPHGSGASGITARMSSPATAAPSETMSSPGAPNPWSKTNARSARRSPRR